MGYSPPFFNVRKLTGYYSIYPDGVTTEDLYIYANPVDVTPLIKMLGTGAIVFEVASAQKVQVADGGGVILQVYDDATDLFLEGTINNHNIYLKTTGSGMVKFGTHVGSGDVACNGSISIVDSGGTTRKLMTTA